MKININKRDIILLKKGDKVEIVNRGGNIERWAFCFKDGSIGIIKRVDSKSANVYSNGLIQAVPIECLKLVE